MTNLGGTSTNPRHDGDSQTEIRRLPSKGVFVLVAVLSLFIGFAGWLLRENLTHPVTIVYLLAYALCLAVAARISYSVWQSVPDDRRCFQFTLVELMVTILILTPGLAVLGLFSNDADAQIFVVFVIWNMLFGATLGWVSAKAIPRKEDRTAINLAFEIVEKSAVFMLLIMVYPTAVAVVAAILGRY